MRKSALLASIISVFLLVPLSADASGGFSPIDCAFEREQNFDLLFGHPSDNVPYSTTYRGVQPLQGYQCDPIDACPNYKNRLNYDEILLANKYVNQMTLFAARFNTQQGHDWLWMEEYQGPHDFTWMSGQHTPERHYENIPAKPTPIQIKHSGSNPDSFQTVPAKLRFVSDHRTTKKGIHFDKWQVKCNANSPGTPTITFLEDPTKVRSDRVFDG